MLLSLALPLLLASPLLIIFARNKRVLRHRSRLLERIAELDAQDIRCGLYTAPSRRHKRLDAISYDRMIWEFWTPVNEFFRSEDFYVDTNSSRTLTQTPTTPESGSQSQETL